MFLLQATDSTFDLALDKSIDIDVDDIMCDGDIGSWLDPIKMIEKTLKKINEDILHLLSFNRRQARLKKRLMFS